MNDYLKRKIQFKLLDYVNQLQKDRLHGMSESLICIAKDNLTDVEFKEFIVNIEKGLNTNYSTQRMQMLSKIYYILKVTPKGTVKVEKKEDKVKVVNTLPEHLYNAP